MANHVHVQDAVFVKLLDDMFGRHADRRDEDFGFLGNDDVHQLIQGALCVVKLIFSISVVPYPAESLQVASTYIGFASASANLRDEQINAERQCWVSQTLLQRDHH